MAINAAMVWEVRSGGASTNGGGFKAGASGTDRSLQTAAQTTYTDLVIDGVAGTKLTSAAFPFSSADVGNVINITGGTGFTVGRYEVLSVTGVIATMDRVVGTIDSTGGAGKLGGALSAIEDGDGAYVAGNLVYLESGTYTKASTRTLTCDGTTSAGNIQIIGYPSGGTRANADIAESDMPVLTSATNSVALVTLNAANLITFRNIKFTHTAGTRGAAVVNATANTVNGPTFINCKFDGCLHAMLVGTSAATSFKGAQMTACAVHNCTGAALNWQGSHAVTWSLDACDFSANAGHISTQSGSNQTINARRCVFRGATASNHGFTIGTTTANADAMALILDRCVFYGNGGSGLRFEYTTGRHSFVDVSGCIFYNNGGYGISAATAGILDGAFPPARFNAFGANTSGARQNFRAGAGDVALTADPFTNAAAGDFSLNNTAGGGALLRQLGWPSRIGVLGGATTASYSDIGAADHQESAGGSFNPLAPRVVQGRAAA